MFLITLSIIPNNDIKYPYLTEYSRGFIVEQNSHPICLQDFSRIPRVYRRYTVTEYETIAQTPYEIIPYIYVQLRRLSEALFTPYFTAM